MIRISDTNAPKAKASKPKKATSAKVQGEFINKERAKQALCNHLRKLLEFLEKEDCTLTAPGDIGCVIRTIGSVLLKNKVHLPKNPIDIESGSLPFEQMDWGIHGDWVWPELFKHFDIEASDAARDFYDRLHDESHMAWAKKVGTSVSVHLDGFKYVKYHGDTDSFTNLDGTPVEGNQLKLAGVRLPKTKRKSQAK